MNSATKPNLGSGWSSLHLILRYSWLMGSKKTRPAKFNICIFWHFDERDMRAASFQIQQFQILWACWVKTTFWYILVVEPFISSLPFGSKHDSAETGQGSKYGEADCSITGHHGEAQSALGCEVGMELMQHAQRNNSVYVVIHHYPIDILCTHTRTHTYIYRGSM